MQLAGVCRWPLRRYAELCTTAVCNSRMSSPYNPYGHHQGRYYNRERLDTTNLWILLAVLLLIICLFQPLRDFVTEVFHVFLESVGLDWLLLKYYRGKQRVLDAIRWVYFQLDALPALEKEKESAVATVVEGAQPTEATALKSRQARQRHAATKETPEFAQASTRQQHPSASVSSGAAAMPLASRLEEPDGAGGGGDEMEEKEEEGFQPVLSHAQRKALKQQQQQLVGEAKDAGTTARSAAPTYPDYWLTFDPLLGLVPLKDIQAGHTHSSLPSATGTGNTATSAPPTPPAVGPVSPSVQAAAVLVSIISAAPAVSVSVPDRDGLPDLRPAAHLSQRTKKKTAGKGGKGGGKSRHVVASLPAEGDSTSSVQVRDAPASASASASTAPHEPTPAQYGQGQDEDSNDDDDDDELPLPPPAARSIVRLAGKQAEQGRGKRQTTADAKQEQAPRQPEIAVLQQEREEGQPIGEGAGEDGAQDGQGWQVQTGGRVGRQQAARQETAERMNVAAAEALAPVPPPSQPAPQPVTPVTSRAVPDETVASEEEEERLALEMRLLQRQWEQEQQEEVAAEEGWETVPNVKR